LVDGGVGEREGGAMLRRCARYESYKKVAITRKQTTWVSYLMSTRRFGTSLDLGPPDPSEARTIFRGSLRDQSVSLPSRNMTSLHLGNAS